MRELLGALAAEGLAPETVKGIKGTLARALDQAVIDDVLPRNVARLERKKRTRRTGAPAEDKVAFTPDEVARVLEGSRTDRFGVLWATLLYTGLRFGKATALAWRDLDGDARTLTVARSLERVAAGAPVFGDPKTFASRRPLRIPATLATLLRAHKARQNTERLRAGGAYRDHGLVFASAGGAPLVHANLWRSFKGLMKRLGLPAASPHTSRQHRGHEPALRRRPPQRGVPPPRARGRRGDGQGVRARARARRGERLDAPGGAAGPRPPGGVVCSCPDGCGRHERPGTGARRRRRGGVAAER